MNAINIPYTIIGICYLLLINALFFGGAAWVSRDKPFVCLVLIAFTASTLIAAFSAWRVADLLSAAH